MGCLVGKMQIGMRDYDGDEYSVPCTAREGGARGCGGRGEEYRIF